jgi:hypothetical protein
MKWLRFRYSLRIFLAAIIGVAVALGIWTHRVSEQKRMVRILRGMHFEVKYDVELKPDSDWFSSSQLWLAERLGKDWVSAPVEAKAKAEAVYPEDLELLTQLCWLRSVDLQNTTADDEGLVWLARLPHL